MASSSYVPDGAQEALLTLVALVYPCPLPKGRKLAASGCSFSKAFAAPGTPAATTASMESIDKLRDEVMEELGKAKPNPPGITAAVDRYAPQLHRIIQSIDASTDPVRLTQRMQFQWTSALNTQALSEFKTQEVFIFEMAMVLATKALAHINQAASVVDPSNDRYADAASLLKNAGGVFVALSQDFLPRWKETPENAAGRHPETSEGVAMALTDLVSAQAQMMYVAKGLFAGNVPKGTLAKLAVAVTERMDKCASNFRARASPHFARLDPDLLLYLTFVPALYRALSHRLLAQAHWDKGEHGVAIGLLTQAQALLKTRADATSAGLPAIDRSKLLSQYQPQLDILRREVNGLLTSWKQDNNMIYFAAVPDPTSLPPLPSGTNMVTLAKYKYVSELPQLAFSEPAEAKTS